jgi:hypothetical protein
LRITIYNDKSNKQKGYKNMDISIFADSIEDISIVPGGQTLDISLTGIDLSQLIREIGSDALLEELDKDEIVEYLNHISEEEDE